MKLDCFNSVCFLCTCTTSFYVQWNNVLDDDINAPSNKNDMIMNLDDAGQGDKVKTYHLILTKKDCSSHGVGFSWKYFFLSKFHF